MLNRKIAHGVRLGLSRPHARLLAGLRTPEKIQDFVTALPTNFEPDGDTCLSVAETLRQNRAHCIEGALVAACALWIGGKPPLLMDFQAEGDDDHVIAIFQHRGCWGAISKTNHIWLRWRDPVYRSLRELAMSYFHEYVFGARKTLRRYSRPYDLSRIDPKLWVSKQDDCWEIATAVDEIPHFSLISAAQARRLRRRDAMEQRAGKLVGDAAPNARSARRY